MHKRSFFTKIEQPRPRRSGYLLKSILSLIFIALLFSCSNQSAPNAQIYPDNTTHFNGQAMTIDYHIIVGNPLNSSAISTIQNIILSTFQEVDSTYNKWNPSSELSRLNQLKADQEVTLSPALAIFLTQVQLIVDLSEGRFDPTIEPLQKLWKDKLKKGLIPTDTEIAAIQPSIGWNKIHINNGIFSKDHDKTALDLGGIAKGLCVDLLVEQLTSQGFKDVYVEWGGEIRCQGKHPSDRDWTVFISRLGNTDPSQAITLLPLHNSALATSGDYLQHWTILKDDLTTYFHIFDPKGLHPLESSMESIASASVQAPSCAFADGLATAAMMFGSVIEAEAWANRIKEKHPEVSFWLVTREK
jgi:thiamine biosynthesis lipoprotein